MRSVGRLVPRRLLDERHDAAVGIGRDDAEGGGVLDAMERDGGFGAALVVEGDERADVEVGEDVAVDDDELLGDAGVLGGEADGAGGVERLGLDGVVQLHAVVDAVGVRLGEPSGRYPIESTASSMPCSAR